MATLFVSDGTTHREQTMTRTTKMYRSETSNQAVTLAKVSSGGGCGRPKTRHHLVTGQVDEAGYFHPESSEQVFKTREEAVSVAQAWLNA